MNIKFTKGYCRFVLLIGAFAIKIPRRLSALQCNKREKQLWYNSDEKTKQMLCPVIFACRFVVIMQRCDAFTNHYLLPEASRFEAITTDVTNWNFGKFKGNLVCLDYGSL